MRSILALCGIVVLTACGGAASNKSSVDREARSLNTELRKEARQQAKEVQVGGTRFRVGVIDDGFYSTVATSAAASNFVLKRRNEATAVIDVIGQGPNGYTVADVEAAARQVSGCKASFNAGVLTLLGGFEPSTDLSTIAAKASKFNGWSTSLAC